MLRADREDRGEADGQALLAAFNAHLREVDVVVLSDYAKGVLTPVVLKAAIAAANAAGKPVIVDPKSRDFSRYDGATLIKPNRREAAEATGVTGAGDEAAAEAADAILATAPNLAAALITRGGAGMTLAVRGEPPVHLPATALEVFDVSGAGDTVAATLALALGKGRQSAGRRPPGQSGRRPGGGQAGHRRGHRRRTGRPGPWRARRPGRRQDRRPGRGPGRSSPAGGRAA
jgi:D-beta-D-heptose 7-phosphate kinase/D-beta-D-heptose 1-phosphate adenosyltransferase